MALTRPIQMKTVGLWKEDSWHKIPMIDGWWLFRAAIAAAWIILVTMEI